MLTSARTFSAAEGFAYDVQSLRRATIVGEVTGGGAHPSQAEKLDTNFLIVIPTGRVINMVTRTDWEGTGVKPDVAVPADRALDIASTRRSRSSRRRRSDALRRRAREPLSPRGAQIGGAGPGRRTAMAALASAPA